MVPLLALELWVGRSLFEHVPYTNSLNMDPQIAFFEASDQWDYIALGSSETRWGIDPAQIDAALANQNLPVTGFNLGFDGFAPSNYLVVLPGLKLPERLPALKMALIEVNLVETPMVLPGSWDQGFSCEGLLQRSVLVSAFAKDYGLDYLCHSRKWPSPLVAQAEKVSAIVRYRQPLRRFLLGSSQGDEWVQAASNGLTQYPNGFFGHLAIADNQKEAAIDLQRFLAKAEEIPEYFQPMPTDRWPELLTEHNFFDRWVDYFAAHDILLVFVAAPTNPVMIEALNRRADYLRNSQLLLQWAQAHPSPVVFIDLGILDEYDPQQDYADFRHLSEAGALRFSRALGAQLARSQAVVEALRE